MPIKSLYALTIVLYVASGLLVAVAARSWRNLARAKRLASTRAFRKTARLTAISLAMLAGTSLCAALVGVLSSGCAASSPCNAGTTSNASVTVHLDEARPAIEAALIAQSDRLTRDCIIGYESACGAAGQIASALESRGYCRPDASGRWQKTGECAQINGKPDLTLGLPRAGSVDVSPQSTVAKGWRFAKRAKRAEK
jgi:hypothetical protein